MKLNVKLLCFSLLMLLLTSFKQKEVYNEYCNDKYNFCIQYPKNFTEQQAPEGDDGRTFLSKDKKAEIKAYASLAIEGLDQIDQIFETAIENIKVAYKVKKADFFILSGTDKKGRIVYRKTVKKKISYMGKNEDTDAFQTLMITYPAGQKALYADYCNKIAKSL